ncbi:MAG: putative integral rane protein [Gemmataceae bacterium]|nr:putative integral rane protein [Gemmataceae bacterium]
MNAELLMLLGGGTAFALTLHWVRSRELGERHALGWILAATVALLCGLFPHTLMELADASRLSYPTAALFVALGAGYLFAFAVSVALTRLHRRCVRLLQVVALLEHRLKQLEGMRADGAAGGRPAGTLPPAE